MPTRKQPPEASKPAFVVQDAQHTDYLGLTKTDWFSGFVLMGIFAGPAGRAILNSKDGSSLTGARDVARRMGDLMAARSQA